MRSLRTLLFSLLLAVPCAFAAPAVLPTVTAYNLDRLKITLPTDFAAPLNFLILSFVRDQQPVVESWIPVVGSDGKAQTWVVPISGRESGLYRWWLNASLRGNLPPTLPRKYWVPLYVNKSQFLRSLDVSSEKDVVLLLTDRSGHVLWRENGAVTDSKKAALLAAINQAESH
jgi:hypothetical protein